MEAAGRKVRMRRVGGRGTRRSVGPVYPITSTGIVANTRSMVTYCSSEGSVKIWPGRKRKEASTVRN